MDVTAVPPQRAIALRPRGPRLGRPPAPPDSVPDPPALQAEWDGSCYVLERARPLSQSLVWELQRFYYASRGIDAWGKSEVPLYVTSNPTIAEQYAALALAAMQDARAAGLCGPQVIFELGAGSGRFAFLFLKRLTQLCEDAGLPADAFLYVMSDFAPGTIASWQTHPQLREFFERGTLHTAHIDLARPGELVLQQSGETLADGALATPPVLIANYVFDTLPQELFYIADERVRECAVTLYSEIDPAQCEAAELLEELRWRIEIGPQAELETGDARTGVLHEYRPLFDGAYVALPTGAFDAIDRFRRLCEHGVIVLAADKGEHRPYALREFELAHHGSVSLDVDFHAIGAYCTALGGLPLFAHRSHRSIDVCAFVFGRAERNPLLIQRFREEIQRFGPDDFFSVTSHAKATSGTMDVRAIAGYLRLARYDSELLSRFLPDLLRAAPNMAPEDRELTTELVERCRQSHFWVGTERDLAFDLGVLFYEMDDAARALECFSASARHAGLHAGTMFNAALCFGRVGEPQQERSLLEQLLALAPAYTPAAERLRAQE